MVLNIFGTNNKNTITNEGGYMDEFLISGPKKLEVGKVRLRDACGIEYPLDKDARYVYYSKAGGFIPPEDFKDTPLSNPPHYGAGGFEGVRLYYTQFGAVFPELESNIVRLMFSTLAFDNIIQKELIEAQKNENVASAGTTRLIPKEFFEKARECYASNKEPELYSIKIKKRDESMEEKMIKLRMRAVFENKIVDFGMKGIETTMKTLAYANRLVSKDYFPNALEMVMSGYYRPFFWVSGEEGLKVPTEGKPFYFAIATLPWGTYLDEKYYEVGLDVVYAPYPRIDKDMPTDKKIAGNYVNSAININLARRLGYSEILALKDGNVVEGSAENIFVFEEKGGGRYRVFIPPIGKGALPGTTRDRVIRVLEGMENVEIVYESPSKETVEKACAVLFSGTGAQLIHARSVTEERHLQEIAEASMLASEDEENREVLIVKKDDDKRTVLINGGKKHEIISEVQRRYEALVLQPENVRPAYDIDIDALAKILKLDVSDFTTKEERDTYRSGYLHDYKNYLKDVAKKTAMTASVIEKGFKKARLLV